MSNKNNNRGYEYEYIQEDKRGHFIEVWSTDEQGEKDTCDLAIFVNTSEDETVTEAIAATQIELYEDFETTASYSKEELERMRKAFEWFKEAFKSIMDAKENT